MKAAFDRGGQRGIVTLHVKGVVVKFDSERGFGFIRSQGRSDVFVRRNNVRGRNDLRVGQSVTFDVETTPKGDRATNVLPGRVQRNPLTRFLVTAAVVTTIAGVASARWLELTWAWAYLLGINLSTFLLYAYDKTIAGSTRLRVPENVLHILALLGGTPAAFAGQRVFRHKTLKRSFQAWFLGIAAVQVGLFVAYTMLSDRV